MNKSKLCALISIALSTSALAEPQETLSEIVNVELQPTLSASDRKEK